MLCRCILGGLALLLGASACGSDDFTTTGSASTAGTGGGATGAGASGTGTGAAGGTGGGSGATGGAGACASGTVCVPAAPQGWAGPAAIYQGPLDVQCGSAWKASLAGHVGAVHADNACSPCGCAPMGASCSLPQVTFHSGSNCSGSAFTFPLDATGACMPLGAASAGSQPSLVGNDGNCLPQGGTPMAPPPTWDGEARICSEPDAALACDGGVCVAEPDAPLEPAFCLYADGDVPSCPDGYPTRTVVYRGVMDDRACGACVCGDLTGSSCSETFDTFSDDTCMTALGQLPGDSTCHSMANVKSMKFNTKSKGGSCAPSGGAATGGVEASLPVTICCAR